MSVANGLEIWHSGWSTEVNEHMEWVSGAVVKTSTGVCILASSRIQSWSPGIQKSSQARVYQEGTRGLPIYLQVPII